MKNFAVFLMLLLGALAVGCAGKGYAAPKPDLAPVGLSGDVRNDCSQIMGTPFRSEDERHWFETNCSKWPSTSFDTLNIAKGKPEDPACAAMRGRPYANDKDRQWFLANCNGSSGTPTASSSSDPAVFADSPSYSCAPIAGPTPAATPTSNGNQRGPQATKTPQPSQSCGPPPSAGPAPIPGDRTDCYAIGGTLYHSATEQAWFMANCMGGQPTAGQPPAAQPPAAGQQALPQSRYCNPTQPGYPNARGRVTQPC